MKGALSDEGAEIVAANAAEAVDTNFDGHIVDLLISFLRQQMPL
jgi:hypothetical protein